MPDKIPDQDFRSLVTNICRRPGMWVLSEKDMFGAVHAYISGFNAARSDAPLLGFQQWLVVRRNGGNNVVWPGTHRRDLDEPAGSQSDEELIKRLGLLIHEFLDYREREGLTMIFHDYSTWLLGQSWYQGPLRKKVTSK